MIEIEYGPGYGYPIFIDWDRDIACPSQIYLDARRISKRYLKNILSSYFWIQDISGISQIYLYSWGICLRYPKDVLYYIRYQWWTLFCQYRYLWDTPYATHICTASSWSYFWFTVNYVDQEVGSAAATNQAQTQQRPYLPPWLRCAVSPAQLVSPSCLPPSTWKTSA